MACWRIIGSDEDDVIAELSWSERWSGHDRGLESCRRENEELVSTGEAR